MHVSRLLQPLEKNLLFLSFNTSISLFLACCSSCCNRGSPLLPSLLYRFGRATCAVTALPLESSANKKSSCESFDHAAPSAQWQEDHCREPIFPFWNEARDSHSLSMRPFFRSRRSKPHPPPADIKTRTYTPRVPRPTLTTAANGWTAHTSHT